MSGETVSMLGTWMQQMAQGWVLAGLTTSAFQLGLVNLASGLPMLALTMYGGVVADRRDKRLILIAVLVAQAMIALGVGWLVASGQIAVWHVAIAGALLGVSVAFEMPAASALVPELVSKNEMAAAIALDRAVFHGTRLAGPALGGWLIAVLGTATAFYANAVSYLALIAALLTIQPRRYEPAEHERRQSGMREGLTYVKADAPTLRMISILALTTVCISPFFMITMPLYSRHILRVGPTGHGWLLAASGVGAVLGTLALLGLARQRRALYLRVAAVDVALAMAALALAQNLAVAMTAIVALTIGTSTLFGLANTIVQERAPDEIRGRVSAITGLSFFGVIPFSGLIASQLADLAGLRVAMLTGACGFAIGALLLLRSIRVTANADNR